MGSWGASWADRLLSPLTAGASPLHECGERPEDWCRDVATAAKCGALELCRLTVWDRAPGVTVLGAGNAGGCRRSAHLPQNVEMAGESQAAHPSIWCTQAATCLQSKWQKSMGAPGRSQVPRGGVEDWDLGSKWWVWVL